MKGAGQMTHGERNMKGDGKGVSSIRQNNQERTTKYFHCYSVLYVQLNCLLQLLTVRNIEK